MASSTIGKAFIRVAIDSSRVPKGLRATEKSAKAGLQGVQAHAKKGIQSLATYYQSLMSVVQKCVAPLAAITAAKSFANFGDRLSKQASRLAVPPAFLQQVEYLEHSLGLTEGSVETLLSKMNLLGAKATNGSKEALSALEKMGVTLEEFNNMSPEKRIETLLKAIENAGTEAEKQQIAFSVLGKNATQMMGLLRGGLSGYQRTLQDAAKYGMSFTNEQLRQGEEMAQSWYNLQTASKSVWNSIGLISARALLPIVEWIAQTIGAFAQWLQKLDDASNGWASLAMQIGTAGIAAKALLPVFVKIGALIGASLLTPVGMAVTIIGGLSVVLWKNREAIGNWMQSVTDMLGVTDTFQAIGDGFADTLGAMKDQLLSGDFSGAWESMWDGITSFLWQRLLEIQGLYASLLARTLGLIKKATDKMGVTPQWLADLEQQASDAEKAVWKNAEDYRAKSSESLHKNAVAAKQARESSKKAREAIDSEGNKATQAWTAAAELADSVAETADTVAETAKTTYHAAGGFSAAAAYSAAGGQSAKMVSLLADLVKQQGENNAAIKKLGVAQ